MRILRWLIVGLAVFCHGAEPVVHTTQLPRVPALEPVEALRKFSVRPGFRVELVASEPLVIDPIALAFDEYGRLFVVEMRDYSERRDERLGRIRMLTDTNHDGRFETSTVYAQGLGWPTAVICYDGGIFVGCTPDILYLKDNNDDGVADERKLVFTGFGEGLERLNVQGMLNNFHWGLDNRIHGASGLNGGKIKAVTNPSGSPVDLRGKDFSFDPKDWRSIRAESGGGQHGIAFDDFGRKYACHNSRHIMQVMYDDYYANRNPYYSLPPALADIPVDGPSAEVFRLSPEEPWRVLRTKWRVAGEVSGPIEGGGRASGYFTSATGITIYRGDAFGDEFVGDAFIADVGSNLIHRKKIRNDDIVSVAIRPDDERRGEFLASPDLWFRPVQLANAPDGTLWFADMYREVIEHPWSIPASIKQHLDLNSGNDRGRIYRIIPENFRPPTRPALSGRSTTDLVSLLEHPNGWHRDTAARLIYERYDTAAVFALAHLTGHSKLSAARLRALYLLKAFGEIKTAQVQAALKDPEAMVRAHAIRLSGRSPNASLAADHSPHVLYQAAFAAGEHQPVNATLLARVAVSTTSSWIHFAVLSSLSNGAPDVLTELASGPISESMVPFISNLAQIIGAQNDTKAIDQVCRTLTNGVDAFRIATAVAAGLRRAGANLQPFRNKLERLFDSGLSAATNKGLSEATRLVAIDFVAYGWPQKSGKVLLQLVDSGNSVAIQTAAINAMAQVGSASAFTNIIFRWPELAVQARAVALQRLVQTEERATYLFQAIEKGSIRATELTATQVQFLKMHRNAALRQKAAALLPAVVDRGSIVTSYLEALNMPGDISRGQRVYRERCASCHRHGNEGFALGPDLQSMKNSGKEKLLINILDPNREVPANYLSHAVETTDGTTYMGLVTSETSRAITLRQANGAEVMLDRTQIANTQGTGQSLMPEGLEADLKPQDLADLLEFISH